MNFPKLSKKVSSLNLDSVAEHTKRNDPPKKAPIFIFKKLCTCSYMLKLQSPSKCCPFDTHTFRDVFPLLITVSEPVSFDVF